MNPTTQGILRHFLTIGAGALASRGIIGENQIEIAVSSLLGIGAILWSVIDKKRQAKKLEAAKLRAVPVE